MKQIYGNISTTEGLQRPGFCRIEFIPREWIEVPLVPDYSSGRLLSFIQIHPSAYWMSLKIDRNTFSFSQEMKASASGNYYEISISGTVNSYNYVIRQFVETFRNHEFVLRIQDKKGQRIIAGDEMNGLTMLVSYSNTSGPDGKEVMTLNFHGQFDHPILFYNPDNAADLPLNYLVNSTGNFILVE